MRSPDSSDHYQWFSEYLQARGTERAVRTAMAGITASFVCCLVVLVFSGDGPVRPVPLAMTWAAISGGVVAVALWARRWPTRRESVVYGLLLTTSIALACLAFPNPLAALLGCIAFATSGAYLAFFHGTRFVVYNFALAAAVGLVQAVRLGMEGHAGLAVVDLWLVIQINIAMPVAIHVLVRTLETDLVRADLDPLTGLLNRRAFRQRTLGLLQSRQTGHGYLVVALVDLDRFKEINDHYGHAVGDQVLVDVAHTLRSATGDRAVVARSGGEEFLIADTSETADTVELAQRICDAVAEPPARVTASIGTACATLHTAPEQDFETLISQLIMAADTAMYQAKRNGGNQSHHHGVLVDTP